MVKIPRDDKSLPLLGEEYNEYLILLDVREEILLNELCGPRYSRDKYPFCRCKTQEKTIFTRFGKICRRFVYVKSKNGEMFSPLLKQMNIPKHQHISEDFKNLLADKPSKMTYAKSAEDCLNSFSLSLSRMTLHKYVKEASQNVVISNEADPTHKVLLADGTKAKGPGMKHEAKTIMSIGDNASDKCLLAQTINKSWRDMAENLDLNQFKVFVGDGEKGLSDAMCKNGMEFQFCHEHAKRDLSFYLWKDGLTKKKSAPYRSEFEGILHCLQNSTKKHKADKDFGRLTERIAWTERSINSLAAKLSCEGLHQGAGFLMRNKKYMATAAKMTILGIEVPWTTNAIERVMQELGNRTKKKGMYWSENGLERILRIVIKRYFLPQERRYYKEVFSSIQKEAVKS